MIKYILASILLLFSFTVHSQETPDSTTVQMGSKTVTPLKTPLYYRTEHADVIIPTLEAAFQYAATCSMMVQYGLDQIKKEKIIEELDSTTAEMNHINAIVNSYDARAQNIWKTLPDNAFGELDYLTTRTDVMVDLMMISEIERRFMAHLCVYEFERFLLADLSTLPVPEEK